MKCKECEKLGLRSRVTVLPPFRDESDGKKEPKQFYDEDGNYHYHDPLVHRMGFMCSQGHKTEIAELHSCPGCDYKGDA